MSKKQKGKRIALGELVSACVINGGKGCMRHFHKGPLRPLT